MTPVTARLVVLFLVFVTWVSCDDRLPVVINTWPFLDANKGAVDTLKNGGSYLDAVESGCSVCEVQQCSYSVGFGGSPNEEGETTLDAMIMDGETHDVGAVGCLKEVKSAISVARSVMEHTEQTFLVGDDATKFALEMGFQKQDLQTNYSRKIWEDWLKNDCQPNYWKPGTVTPDPTTSCGPYTPTKSSNKTDQMLQRQLVDRFNHDTIGMIVVDEQGRIACGTSTNGLTHKLAGRVGDTPITGAGCYVDKQVGGAAATGDGDVMMRFLPTFHVVESMRRGMSPTEAVEEALNRIDQYYPAFQGALIAVDTSGNYGAANHGFSSFEYTVYNPQLKNSTVIVI